MSLILSGTDGLSDVDGSAATPAIRGTDANTGMFFPAADTIAFSEGGVESMRIDSAGNLGIGTSSPTGKLDVVSGSSLVGRFYNNAGRGQVAVDGTSDSSFVMRRNGTQIGWIQTDSSGLEINTGTNGAHPYAFYTNSTERMRIDSSGNVGIGTSSPVTKLTVTGGNGNAITSTNTGQQYSGFEIANNGSNKVTLSYDNTNGIAALNTRGANPFTFGTSDTERMRITSGGDVFVGNTTGSFSTVNGALIGASGRFLGTCTNDATFAGSRLGSDGNVAAWYRNTTLVGSISVTASTCSFNNLSDYRIKENVTPLTNALSKISKLKPCIYTFTLDGAAGEGFIAHELAEVCPQAVTGEKDAVDKDGKPVYQGVDTSFLIATLTAAIQEQQALIENLTTRLNALEGK